LIFNVEELKRAGALAPFLYLVEEQLSVGRHLQRPKGSVTTGAPRRWVEQKLVFAGETLA
jgi:hypothetical protein